jgi:hypothetical protein
MIGDERGRQPVPRAWREEFDNVSASASGGAVMMRVTPRSSTCLTASRVKLGATSLRSTFFGVAADPQTFQMDRLKVFSPLGEDRRAAG